MKMIFVVFSISENGKFHAFADTIRTGENIRYYVERYNCDICHLCESRKHAEDLAAMWNEQYKKNGTNLY